MSADESLWDINEVAKYLKISKDTVYRWIEKKQMPALKVGKRWLFQKEEILSWLRTFDNHDGSK